MTEEQKTIEITLLSGEGEITFRLIKNGQIEIEMFDQRSIKDVFCVEDRNNLTKWLVNNIIS